MKLAGKLALILLGLLPPVLLLAAAELGARLLWKEDAPKTLTDYPPEYYILDEQGITKAHPSGRYPVSSIRTATGERIYDVVYNVDACSRRITPVSGRSSRTNHLLFFGCSFMYGEGLQEDQTLPAQMAGRLPDFMPYNYGFHGHSPAEMLAKIRAGTLPEEVPEREGALVYLFMDAHISRVIGSMQIVTTWGKNRPYYRLGPNGELIRQGDFATGRPGLQRVYEWLAKSRLVQALRLDFPPVTTRRHLHLVARLIEESFAGYHRQFPNSRAYVVLYPRTRYGPGLGKILASKGITVLNCSGLFNDQDPEYLLAPEDRHPSAKAWQVLSERLAADSGLAGVTISTVKPEQSVYDFTMKTIDGKEQPLSAYKGKALLIVNVASKCGFTPQYKGLEALYEKYKTQGLVILGFPANNFGWQEPGSDQQIQQFCSTTYGVTFPMFSKISVKGGDIHPLYKYLTESSTPPGDISWNFNKFLIDPSGHIAARWGSKTTPEDKELLGKVEETLR